MARDNDKERNVRCSFCGKTQEQVDKLIAGPGVYICDECIELCQDIMDDENYAVEDEAKFEAKALPTPKEIKDTLEKVASYNEMLNLKAMRKGIFTMGIVFIILVQISLWKELSPAPLFSLVCAYSGASLISKARAGKDKYDWIIGSICLIAMALNTIAFILM